MKLLRWIVFGGAAGAAAYWLYNYLRPSHSELILTDSVVVITGASSGIGRAYATSFARKGAKLVLAARREDLLAQLEHEIAPYAADILLVPTDVNDPLQLQALVDQTLARYGRIDILVNNAGVLATGLFHTISPIAIRNMVRTNYEAVMLLTQLVLPTMLAQRAGRIVNVASVGGIIAAPTSAPYSSAKRGVLAFSDALRRELSGTGVDVISVLPSWTRSEMLPPELESGLGHVDSAEFVAETTIAALLRNEANVYFGDAEMRVGMWLDRHLPRVMNLLFRMRMTPAYIDANMRYNMRVRRATTPSDQRTP